MSLLGQDPVRDLGERLEEALRLACEDVEGPPPDAQLTRALSARVLEALAWADDLGDLDPGSVPPSVQVADQLVAWLDDLDVAPRPSSADVRAAIRGLAHALQNTRQAALALRYLLAQSQGRRAQLGLLAYEVARLFKVPRGMLEDPESDLAVLVAGVQSLCPGGR